MTAGEVVNVLRARSTGTASPYLLPLSRVEGLPALWRELGYTKGLEMGVERGLYSMVLLHAMPDLTLTCVDAWTAYSGYREHVTQAKLDGFYQETVEKLAQFGDRARVVKAFSENAAAGVPDGSLDFVYIDGNHVLPQVIADLAAWSPKVRSGGIIAGHDYGRSSVGHVQEAVVAWTQAYRIESWFVTTGERTPSWLWVQR